MSVDVESSPQWSVPELTEVAKWQRYLIWLITAQVLSLVFVLVTSALSAPGNDAAGVVALLLLAFRVCAVAFSMCVMYKLANACGNSAVLYVLAMFIPLISLLALANLNAKATAILQGNGIDVGIMGADPADLERIQMQDAATS